MRVLLTAAAWHALVCVLAVVLGAMIVLNTKGVAPPLPESQVRPLGWIAMALAAASLYGLARLRRAPSAHRADAALVALPFVASLLGAGAVGIATPLVLLPGAILGLGTVREGAR